MCYMLMKNFVLMSKYAGMREDLVQAGGGNSAYKLEPNKMAIKASGYQLADVSETSGYAIVNPQIIKDAFLNCNDLDSLTEIESKKILEKAFIEGARPSIETFLHSILGMYSLHTHPIVVNALACRENGDKELLQLFPDALIVPYATPGVELAKAYFKEYKKYKLVNNSEPKFIFLMNHGFITSADTADEVIELTEFVTLKIEQYLGIDMSPYHDMQHLMTLYKDGILWKVTDHNILNAYKTIGQTWQHYFCPDCVVFIGKQIFDCGSNLSIDDYKNFVEQNGSPVVLIYKGNIFIHASSVKKAMEIQSVLSFSAQVMLINRSQQCSLLSEQEKNFLLNWDAEKYRKGIK